MLSLSFLLLAVVGFNFVSAQYPNCKKDCQVYYVDEEGNWGIENDDWCLITSSCGGGNGNGKCFSYPDYPCCNGCTVVEVDAQGKWGIENNNWCGIQDKCNSGGGSGGNGGNTSSNGIADGWYTIMNYQSQSYLSVSGGSDGANVSVGSNKDKWKITNIGSGYVTITSMYGDYMIDVSNSGDKSDGMNIQIYGSHGENAQQFIFQKTSETDVYFIGTKNTGGDSVIEVEKQGSGTNVQQYAFGNKTYQAWVVKSVSAPSSEEINPPRPVSNFKYDSNMQFKEAPGQYLNRCQQAGKLNKENYNGVNGGNTLIVYTPYNYDSSKQYNIFYLMHGGGENENTIFGNDVNLQNILDHMIMNGELEPLIVVTPTFNKCEAQTFYKEFHDSVVPFVEGKYSTYAKSTNINDLKASRMHRAYGGFSMGGVSTWAVLIHCLDIVGYFMPLSGDCWDAQGNYQKAKVIADAISNAGLKQGDYFIFVATGSDDIAYPNVNPQVEEMKKMSQFTYTSDFSKGNFYFLVAPGKTHWWGYVRHYIYDALPSFFHENQ